MQIELIYALPHEQKIKVVDVKVDCTVAEAIECSGILQDYPELTTMDFQVGIFSKIVNLTHKLQDGDRVEIYRPLTIDPKEARRLRSKT